VFDRQPLFYDRIMKGLRARVDAGKQFKPAG
jgi:hypothetical protein